MNEQIIHELTMLYLNTSTTLPTLQTPEDYAQVYMDTSKRIRQRFAENAPTKPKHATTVGVVNKGISF